MSGNAIPVLVLLSGLINRKCIKSSSRYRKYKVKSIVSEEENNPLFIVEM